MKEVVEDQEWIGRTKGKCYENKRFVRLAVRRGTIKNCVFRSCEFHNCYLGFSSFGIRSIYSNCTFDNVKIFGKYSSMGNSTRRNSRFENCTFKDVEIRGTNQLYGVEFIGCTFSGKFVNCIFNDFGYPKKSTLGVRFRNCNIEGMVFRNTSIYGRELFTDCSLPKNEMIYLNNRDNCLISRAEELISRIGDRSITTLMSVLFDKSIHFNQDVIMIDETTLKGMIRSPQEYELYRSVTDEFVIK